jgi:hypothetical protein
LFPKILYPYHPLFGKDHEAFGSAGGERDMVYVRLADRSTRGVPAWMFDPAACSGVKLADKPAVAFGALVELSRLLDRREAVERIGVNETTRKQRKGRAAGEV